MLTHAQLQLQESVELGGAAGDGLPPLPPGHTPSAVARKVPKSAAAQLKEAQDRLAKLQAALQGPPPLEPAVQVGQGSDIRGLIRASCLDCMS